MHAEVLPTGSALTKFRAFVELTPETGLAAVFGPQTADEAVVRLRVSNVRDARRETGAFKQVPGRMLVAGGLCPIQRVLDHRTSEQGGRHRVLAFDQSRCWVEHEVQV